MGPDELKHGTGWTLQLRATRERLTVLREFAPAAFPNPKPNWRPSEHMYARVTGTLKQFGTKRYLNVAHIQPATDPHELLYHSFEAIYVTLAFSRGLVSLLLELVRDRD